MTFEKRFKAALERMIPKEHDDYEELKYSDTIYVQVWSHDNGAGSFEIEAIVPHDSVPEGVDVTNCSQLPPDLPTAGQLYGDVEQLLKDVTGDEFTDIVFQLTSVVDDGAWDRDASVFSTFELKTENY
jgi:hypothetical protein